MCGIAGAIRTSAAGAGTASRERGDTVCRYVQRMTEAQRHRGPDGSGLWESKGGEVVFGHRRLAILDLSEAGAQPMIDGDSGCAVTFNGEIYNFREIRRDLEAAGESFRSSSDTEVLLKAHKRWGIDAVKRFRGIFALALWDPRARAVHLVRDQMGIKPLYWTAVRDADTGEELVLFASELRGLLASGAVPRRLDPAAVASYLWHGFVIGPHTMIDGVQLLPAASIMTIGAAQGAERGNAREAQVYWQMPSSSDRKTGTAELREELVKTVQMQLVSDVPLGVFLSGGVDSSAVAALASEVAAGSLHTFTIGFDLPAYDESRYARQVAEAIHSRHTSVVLTEQAFQEQLPDALASIDQPTFDAINTYFVSRAAREAGMTVALAGTGGDELFGGYSSYLEIPKALALCDWLPLNGGTGPLKRAFDGAVAFGSGLAGRVYWDLLGIAPPQTRWGKLADLTRALRDPLGLYQVYYARLTRDAQSALATRALRGAQSRLDSGLPPEVARDWRRAIAGSERRHAVSLLELSSYVGQRLLRDTDAASMAVSLEVRVPLLDHVLIETVAGLDPDRRFSPPRKKQLLREAALSGLDPAVFDRPKAGFVLPIDTWARQRLQPQMDALFADEELAARVGLHGSAVGTLWRSFTAGRPGQEWSRVWSLYVLLSWCRTHDVSLAA